MILAGTQLVWSGTVKRTVSDVLKDQNGLIASINAEIAANNINVLSYSSSLPDVISQLLAIGNFSFQLTLTVSPVVAFNQATDIQDIINHAVYDQTGQLPASSSITEIGGQSTGNPSAPSPTNLFSGIGSSVGSALSGVINGTLGTLSWQTYAVMAVGIIALATYFFMLERA